MKIIIKFLVAISIAFITYALVGYASRYIIHTYLLPINFLDLSYYDVFAKTTIVIAGSIVSFMQLNKPTLKWNLALWAVLLYWIFSAVPAAFVNSQIGEYSFGVSWINAIIGNIWSGSSAFYTHQLLEIVYLLGCVFLAFIVKKYSFTPNYVEA